MSISRQIQLPHNHANGKQFEAHRLWLTIPANSDRGVEIHNVQEGDEIVIERASGICSFKKTNMAFLEPIIGLANAAAEGAVLFATDGEAEEFMGPWNKQVGKIQDEVGNITIKHARRDAFGQDPGSRHWGKNEGGIIVCMPSSKGPIYASGDKHFKGGAKGQGRKVEFYGGGAQHCFFPDRVPGATMSAVAKTSGTISILAFDSNFSDNAGAYHLEAIVYRKSRPSGRTKGDLKNALYATPNKTHG